MPRAIFPVREKTRQGILAEAQRALEVYNTSGKSALIAELAQTQASKGKPRRMAANYFLYKMHQDGFKAALSALDLVAALQIPTSG